MLLADVHSCLEHNLPIIADTGVACVHLWKLFLLQRM